MPLNSYVVGGKGGGKIGGTICIDVEVTVMPKIPEGISREHVLAAIRDFDGGRPHSFGDSTKYDLLFEGKRYPPKAILGLAAAHILGEPLIPDDFSGGATSQCNRILRSQGFQIVSKENQDEYSEEKVVLEDFSPFQIGTVVNNDELRKAFKCSTQGGMRRSKPTNTLVVISNHVKSVYGDRWVDNVLHYTGMGLKGDQSLYFAQNKTLNESKANGVDVHLFEVFANNEYTYQGQVKLANSPYQEPQHDQDGNLRRVWIFPLQLRDGAPLIRSETEFLQEQAQKEKKANRLTDDELEKRAGNARKNPGSRSTQLTQYERNPYVAALAKRRANGICDLCNERAPFNKKNGDPYLETHHIIWLSKGGDDTTENTVALCPNCHRRMHVVRNKTAV